MWAESRKELGRVLRLLATEFVVVSTEPGPLQHARHSIRALDPQLPYLQRLKKKPSFQARKYFWIISTWEVKCELSRQNANGRGQR